jgi:hypothetical protein
MHMEHYMHVERRFDITYARNIGYRYHMSCDMQLPKASIHPPFKEIWGACWMCGREGRGERGADNRSTREARTGSLDLR